MTSRFLSTLLLGYMWSITASTLAHADEAHQVQMLRGARTASVHLTLEPGAGCSFDTSATEFTKQVIETLRLSGLQVVPKLEEGFIPDISILVLLETSRSMRDVADGTCNMFVKFEVLHQLTGTLRYSGARPILRALVYRTFRYGSAPSTAIPSAVRSNALWSLREFELAFRNANRSLGSN